ncbi:MAG: dihydroorotase [Mariniblastus sp.]|nr:dihydroorotase [Mariniblastus sp.]
MKTIINNAQVVLPDETVKTSVLIDGVTIAEIGPAIDVEADRVIDATGKWLIPGVVDDQVHFREPGLTHKEDWYHATRACAKGGVTSFLEMPNTIPNTISREALDEKLALASGRCLVNYGFYIGATPDNLAELQAVTRTPGIKIFIGSSTGNLLVDDQSVLEQIFAETKLPICAHCEDEATVRANAERYADATDVATHSLIRDHQAALIATKRSIDLALRHQHPFHVLHVSTAAEIEVIEQAGDLVTGEVCPHHLFFNVTDYDRLGSLVKMNPSVKHQEDNQALWQALIDGKLQVVATDHAPHTLEEKRKPFPECPSGLPAVENSLALMLNEVNQGRIDLRQVVHWMCSEPARIWHLRNKGEIRVGFDADLALIDMQDPHVIRNENQQTKCGWTPWDGSSLTGSVVRTWVLGEQVFQKENGVETFCTDHSRGKEILFDH